jgi:ABC-type multidrug transport system permease subunit
MFMTSNFNGIFFAVTALSIQINQRAIFYRERASNTYGALPYGLAIGFVEIPWVAIMDLIFLIPLYYMVGLSNNLLNFFTYFLALLCNSLCYLFMGQLISVASPNKMIATITQNVFLALFFLFGGALITAPNIPVGWKWLHNIDPLQFVLRAVIMPQYDCSPQPSCSPTIAVQLGFSVNDIPKAEFLSAYLGMTFGEQWTAIGYLVLCGCVLRALTILSLRYICHVKR